MLSVQTHIAVVNMDGVERLMHIVELDVNLVRVQAVSVSLFVVSRGTILYIYICSCGYFMLQYGLNSFCKRPII